jgi:hypothetical protein
LIFSKLFNTCTELRNDLLGLLLNVGTVNCLF